MEKLTQDLDGKENYVSSLVSVLEDIGWIKLEPSGKYIITDKGETEARKYYHESTDTVKIPIRSYIFLISIFYFSKDVNKQIHIASVIS